MKWLVPALAALVLTGSAQAATCSAAEKQAAQAAVAAYLKKMPIERAAYYKRHKSKKQRAAFAKKQRAKLAKLRDAAACEVPPADTTPPKLLSASANAATVTITFDEDVVASGSSFAVRVNGVARAVQSVTTQQPSGKVIVLTLAQPVGGDDTIALDYTGGVKDAAGNVAAPLSNLVVANATPAGCSFMVSSGGLTFGHTEGPTDLSVYHSATGTVRGIVIWVDFPDAPATESIPALTDQIFQPAAAAYSSMSYGTLSLQIDATSRWYRLSHPSTYYGLNYADGPGRKDEYTLDAIKAADPDVDFSKYDIVYLVPAKGASANMATGTQRPPGYGFATADGKEMRLTVLVGDDRLAGPVNAQMQIVHETGHAFGLPDLYGELQAVAGWDPMGFSAQPGAEFFAWHRWKFGWLDPAQVRCVQPGRTVEATLSPLETPGNVKMIVAPLSATKALVLENRQPLGLDTRLCDKGVLAYTVDGSVAYPGAPVHVIRVQPPDDMDPDQQRCGFTKNAALDLGAGETSTMTVPGTGVTIQLVSTDAGSYVVRVTRTN